MQQMGDRLRITTKAAMGLKNTVNEAMEVIQKEGTKTVALPMLRKGIRTMDSTLEGNK